MELQLNLANLHADSVGAAGVTAALLKDAAAAAVRALQVLLENPHGWPLGWLNLQARRSELPRVMSTLDAVADVETLVSIGMGGSGLGTRALAALFAECIGPGHYLGPSGQRLVVLDNLDDENTAAVASMVCGRRTALNPVSKSGTTLETMANFVTLLNWLGERAEVVVTTGEAEGPLGRFAAATGSPLLPVPADVGGRFSVLTGVGFFPLAFLGLSVDALLAGAEEARELLLTADAGKNPALQLAAHLFALATQRGIPQLVFMPYSERMYDLGRWWVQLVAESLGKRQRLSGGIAPTGLTPLVALGPSDQHSILQLLLEGPADKVVSLVEVETPPASAGTIGDPPPELSAFGYLRGKSIHDIVRAELNGTRGSLTNQGRPNYTLTFPRISPEALGEFILLHEIVVGLLGVMLDVNPFDQPAVNEGKELARKLLGAG